MFSIQASEVNPRRFSRCEVREQTTEYGNKLSPVQKTDAEMKDSLSRALWKDNVLRAIEYEHIDVHVKNGTAYLSGHIVNTSSLNRIENAIRAIHGIQKFQNDLILDDRLTNQVASSLGTLEHTYNCKFFTGVSHGLVSLNGIVNDENVKLLAEKCAADHPNVRGVLNHIRVLGAEFSLLGQPFLQPSIGETIYFRDWISGVVKQVVINRNNRRVVAMIVCGQIADRWEDLKSFRNKETRSPARLVVLSMNLVRYMTKVSGFLYINSNEQEQYLDFDSGYFCSPNMNWSPPYPYCPDDVLFPVEQRQVEYHPLEQHPQTSAVLDSQEQLIREQLLADDSPGG